VLTAVFAIATVVFPSAFAQDRGREGSSEKAHCKQLKERHKLEARELRDRQRDELARCRPLSSARCEELKERQKREVKEWKKRTKDQLKDCKEERKKTKRNVKNTKRTKTSISSAALK
jgi:membrane protein involved in colicin uptake